MSATIFLYSEVERDGCWRLAGETEENAYHDSSRNPTSSPRKPVDIECETDYDLFDILCGLQRRRGRNLREYEMIAKKRGLPVDLSIEIHLWHQEFEGDSYGESWLLLSEVLDFDWHGKTMQFEATVDTRVAHLFHEDQPFPFAQWPDHIPIELGPYRRESVKVRWTDSYADSVDDTFFHICKKLETLGDPAQTRLVFWFSS